MSGQAIQEKIMYNNNMVMSINCEGNFLQETKNGEVFIPFLSEYSVFLKNKNSKRALVSVLIDGKDVLNGRSIVLGPNASFDLERFVEDSLEEGRKFRFIKKTESIVSHRGNQPEDSLVEIRFKYEYSPQTYLNGDKIKKPEPFPSYPFGPTCVDGGPKGMSESISSKEGIKYGFDIKRCNPGDYRTIPQNQRTLVQNGSCFGDNHPLRGLSEASLMSSFGISTDSKRGH